MERKAGVAALESGPDVLPESTTEAIEHHGVALKGPCTTPVGDGFTSVNVQLRQRLNLYAAVRPVRSLAGVPTRFQDVDIIIVRENTEGLYSGVENQVTEDVVMSMKVATKSASLRIAHWAFRFATRRQRRKITVFHKANITKVTDGLFLECARRIHQHEYPNIEYEENIIDAGCMKLVQDPSVVSHKYAYESAGPFGRRLRCSSSRGARHTGGFETRPYKSSRLADNQNALAAS